MRLAAVFLIAAAAFAQAPITSINLGGGGGSGGTTVTIANGTATLGTSAIGGNACATVVTVSATGVATTDVVGFTPNADISGATGYSFTSTDGLKIYPYPTSDNVNFKVCNGTASSITPGAVTLNWRVVR